MAHRGESKHVDMTYVLWKPCVYPDLGFKEITAYVKNHIEANSDTRRVLAKRIYDHRLWNLEKRAVEFACDKGLESFPISKVAYKPGGMGVVIEIRAINSRFVIPDLVDFMVNDRDIVSEPLDKTRKHNQERKLNSRLVWNLLYQIEDPEFEVRNINALYSDEQDEYITKLQQVAEDNDVGVSAADFMQSIGLSSSSKKK